MRGIQIGNGVTGGPYWSHQEQSLWNIQGRNQIEVSERGKEVKQLEKKII